MNDSYPFKLKPLTYSYNALEPYIDRETMMFHHDKHLKTYVDNLNEALKDYPEFHNWSLEELICNIYSMPSEIQTSVRNNAGGVYNHNLYFSILRNGGENNSPIGNLAKEINNQFGSFDNFYNMFKTAALNQFGSGYAWLVIDRNGILKIINTPNQNSVLEMNLYPLILVDVWEHAYYLKYQNRRAEYVDNFRKVINWDMIEYRYNEYFRKN